MNDHDALLYAIGEHPEEDTPRLMYADWLEENGEPERADFVRNQVELARFALDDPARYSFVRKNLYYLSEFVPKWKAQLPQLAGMEWGDFNRGLVEEVQTTISHSQRTTPESLVVRHAQMIFSVPGVHILRLHRMTSGEALAQIPALDRLRTLRFIHSRVSAAALRELFNSPYLSKLAVLEMDRNGADNAVAADIADGRFPSLAELWLGSNMIGNDGALALARSPHLTKLRLLDLRNNPIRDQTVRNALRQRFGSVLKM